MMDIVLGYSSLSIVTIRDRMLITGKGRSVQSNNVLYIPVARDDEQLFFVAVSGGLVRNTNSCGLNAEFHVHDNRCRACIVAVTFWNGYPLLRLVCECELPISSAVAVGMFRHRRPL